MTELFLHRHRRTPDNILSDCLVGASPSGSGNLKVVVEQRGRRLC